MELDALEKAKKEYNERIKQCAEILFMKHDELSTIIKIGSSALSTASIYLLIDKQEEK